MGCCFQGSVCECASNKQTKKPQNKQRKSKLQHNGAHRLVQRKHIAWTACATSDRLRTRIIRAVRARGYHEGIRTPGLGQFSDFPFYILIMCCSYTIELEK